MSLTKLLNTFQEESKVVVKKDKIEVVNTGVSLKGVLQRARLKIAKERPVTRQGITFSPSTITYNYCRRAKIGQMAGQIELFYDRARPSEQINFDMGNFIHDMVQGYFWSAGILKGSFRCLKCDKTFDDLISPKTCPDHKSHKRSVLEYREITMTSSEYPIRGRADGIVIIEGEEHLLDIKSIQNRLPSMPQRAFCFEDLDTQGPKLDHIVQLNFYMWMSGVHKGHLLYLGKNNGQIKTFDIPYNSEILQPYLDEIETLLYKSSLLKMHQKVELPAPCGKELCPCDSVLSIL